MIFGSTPKRIPSTYHEYSMHDAISINPHVVYWNGASEPIAQICSACPADGAKQGRMIVTYVLNWAPSTPVATLQYWTYLRYLVKAQKQGRKLSYVARLGSPGLPNPRPDN